MKSRVSCVLFCLALFAASLLAQSPGPYRGKDENLPQPVAPQPIAYSHRVHAEAGLSCQDCHETASKKPSAGLPQAEKCMLCHETIATGSDEIAKLRAFHEAGQRIPWVRVYDVEDFVFFSHKSHVGASVECETCHGPVHERDVLAKEVSTSMIACMNCHAERGASNECFLCHDLGQ